MSVMLAPLGVNARDGRTGTLHRKFALHYAQFMNARQAAIDCGYPPDKAATSGARLLKSKKVIAELARLNVKTQTERVADIQELREYWTAVMRGERQRDIPESMYYKEDGTALTQRERETMLFNLMPDDEKRLKASEHLGKSLGAFIERNESKVQITLVIEDESPNAPPIDVTPRVIDLSDE